MPKLSINTKYSIDEISDELKISTALANGIRNYFGDPITISELKKISWEEFSACKNFWRKRWNELQKALSVFDFPQQAVSLIHRRGLKHLTVEIDVSKPFEKVIQDLSIIINSSGQKPY